MEMLFIIMNLLRLSLKVNCHFHPFMPHRKGLQYLISLNQLYTKLEATKIAYEEKIRAEKVAEYTPVNTEIQYDKSGKIIIYVTLGVMAVATGTIVSQQLPNLTGEWRCLVNGSRQGKLIATETELRQLSEQIKILNCHIGSRLQFIFNTWDRSVNIRIAGEML